MFVIDSHLDLAMNALGWNRDLKQTVKESRRREEGMAQKGRACGTTAFPDMRRGEVGVCLATVIARVASRPGSPDALRGAGLRNAVSLPLHPRGGAGRS